MGLHLSGRYVPKRRFITKILCLWVKSTTDENKQILGEPNIFCALSSFKEFTVYSSIFKLNLFLTNHIKITWTSATFDNILTLLSCFKVATGNIVLLLHGIYDLWARKERGNSSENNVVICFLNGKYSKDESLHVKIICVGSRSRKPLLSQ